MKQAASGMVSLETASIGSWAMIYVENMKEDYSFQLNPRHTTYEAFNSRTMIYNTYPKLCRAVSHFLRKFIYGYKF